MKRLFCFALCTIYLFTLMPVVAAEQQPLLFDTCQMTNDWINGSYPATLLSVDYQNYTQGFGSVRFDGDLTKGNSFVGYTNRRAAVDISAYTHLELDVYVDDPSLLTNAVGQIELSSENACDVAELAFGNGSFLPQIQQSGWNHISLPLSQGVRNTLDPAKKFDPTAVNFFRFYLINLQGEKTTYTFGLDCIYFSDGKTAPDTTVPTSTYKPNAPCADNGIPFGDVNEDGGITALDALRCLQYAVDKTQLTNYGFALGDVDASGKITAADGLEILKYTVKKQEVFTVQTKETLPQTVEVGINGPHLVHTQYPTDSRVIAVTDVIYWGAMGDGVTDDTDAFRTALAYAQSVGGGTVFVPSGHYAIKGTLTIPNGVTLQGDSPAVTVEGKAEGTVLLAYSGRGDEDGVAFLSMDSASAIADFSVYYPEQTMEDITPYPFTVRQVGHYGIGITNVRLVNSYGGICMGPSTNSLQNIRNVVGTPLNMGLILDNNVDICRVEAVSFSPECWLNSGLDSRVNRQALTQYLYQNATAFQFERVDWTYIANIEAVGYHTAFRTCKPTMRQAEESPNGHVYGVKFTDCYIGVDARLINVIGMMMTNGQIHAQIPLQTSGEFTAEFSFNRIDFQTSGTCAVTVQGNGVVSLEHCTLSAAKTGVEVKGGKVLCNRVTFKEVATGVVAGEGTAATLTNCKSSGLFTLADGAGEITKISDPSLKTANFDPEKYEEAPTVVTRPAGDGFANITKEPYLADTTCTRDIGEVLQRALNDMKAAGGGVVYVPAGKYRLDTPITLPTGVELRGSVTVPQHSHALSTTFYTTYGKGEDQTASALITLSSASGVNGFKVYYDEQLGGLTDCDTYAFTLRGQGNNNYVMNVDFINSFYQMDLATNRCDGHYVRGVTGYPLERGIVVGGGSVNGVVRDCQMNLHYFGDNPVYQTTKPSEDFFQYALNHSEAFVVGQTTNQIMAHNFVLGVHSGIVIDEGADVFVLAHGTDVGDYAATLRGTPSGEVVFVNTQLVTAPPANTRAYLNIEPSFTGRVDMTQTNFWGDPGNCSVLVGGGSLYLSQGNSVRSGEMGIKVMNGAELVYNTVAHLREILVYDLYLQEGKAVTYGNLYASGGKLFDGVNGYVGNEF